MTYLWTVLPYVSWMLVYIGLGFLLVKAGWGESAHARSISGILIYFCGPAMVINAFQGMVYSAEEARRIGLFFVVTLAIQALAVGLMALALRKRLGEAKYRILSIAAVLGNVGFLGLPLVTRLFPRDPVVACYSMAYILSMNLIVFTLGVYMITRERKYMSLRGAVLNPTTLAILAALPLYFFKVRLPDPVLEPLAALSRLTVPLCMMVLGMRLASMNLRTLFTQPFAYVGSMLKLVLYPLLAYGCVQLVPGLDPVFKASVLALSAVPSGAIILSLAEQHRCEQEISASVLLMSTLLCAVTIPLVLLVL